MRLHSLFGLLLLGSVLLGTVQRSEAQTYIPCLGCAEHQEIRTRWHRPWLALLATDGILAADHFRLEIQARNLGMCEPNPLLHSSQAVNGCHSFSLTRALLIATPIEILAFTSPSWGLAQRGHPRWAMALELAPITWHMLSIQATRHAINQWKQQQLLLH